MKKFFSNKFNVILIVAIGLSFLTLGLSTLVDFFLPIGLIVSGLTCLYVAFLLGKKAVDKSRGSVTDFVDQDDKIEKKKQSFLEKESRANLYISISGFLLFGVMLIYFAFSTLKMM